MTNISLACDSPIAADARAAAARCELTILMPCLNEAQTLAACIDKARGFLARAAIDGEVLVADNGSTDGSQQIAAAHGARVVAVEDRGYGSALIGGIRTARGSYVIMGDSDGSYDFAALDGFVERLRAGSQLVMGNRFLGGIRPGAMPALHRYLGNPVLTRIGRLFFRSACGDFHCGLRGFDRDAILALDLQASGMEFASEMVVKATIQKLRVAEVPVVLSPDRRNRPSHLRSWRDGWRHLRFLLLFSPRWLFFYPGLAMFLLGLAVMASVLPHSRRIAGAVLDIHTLLYASLAVVIGCQAMLFWVLGHAYGMREGIVPPNPRFLRATRSHLLEKGLVASTGLFVTGLALGVYALGAWDAEGFGPLDPEWTMRLVIPSTTCILLAFQLAYTAFMLSVLEIRATRGGHQDAAESGGGLGAPDGQ